MRVALIGDIHGNYLAFEAVAEAIRGRAIETIVCTGDFVGYYYWPREVIALARELGVIAVRGNHEDMLEAAIDSNAALETATRKYGGGLKAAIDTLSTSDLDWLTALPASRQLDVEASMVLAHGTPRDTDEYIYPDSSGEVLEPLEGSEFVVLGHTHYRMMRDLRGTLVVNPGSVGQPRDRVPGAAWAILDTGARTCEFLTEPYDIGAVVREAKRRDPALPYLADVLTRQ